MLSKRRMGGRRRSFSRMGSNSIGNSPTAATAIASNVMKWIQTRIAWLLVHCHHIFGIIVMIFLIHFFWYAYDKLAPPYRPTQEQYLQVSKNLVATESSPISPFLTAATQYTYNGPSTVFTTTKSKDNDNNLKYHDAHVPCTTHEEEFGSRKPVQEGFFYIKEMKTASTTLAGITARIVRNTAKRKQQLELAAAATTDGVNDVLENSIHNATTSSWPCTSRLVHLRARRLRNRDLSASFLWTMIREPTERLISKFTHFQVSRKSVPNTLSQFSKFLYENEVYDYNYYIKSLSMRERLNPYRTDLYETFVQEILQDYNFIGITERFHESLVVLQLLLNIPTSDLLYLSSKATNTYEYYASQQKCIYIQPKNITMEWKQWLYTSLDFQTYVGADWLLYQAVNASLDRTIEQLGRDRVAKGVQVLTWAQQMAHNQCFATTKFVCDATTGKPTNLQSNDCLFQDVACGYACLDRVGAKLHHYAEFYDILSQRDE